MAENIVIMHNKDIKQVTQKQKVWNVLGTILRYAFLLLVAVVVLFPFY